MWPLWFLNFFILASQFAYALKEVLYHINGSNYRFWFLVLPLWIPCKLKIDTTPKAWPMKLQGIFLHNKLLWVWKIVYCKEILLLFFLFLMKKMEMKLYTFPSRLRSNSFSDRMSFLNFKFSFPLNWAQIVNTRAAPPEQNFL